MQVEQYVMAYEVEQDRLRALLPAGFVSLRPVLRINGEIRRGPEETAYLELSTYPGYMDSFVAACFLPHTDKRLFPHSIQEA